MHTTIITYNERKKTICIIRKTKIGGVWINEKHPIHRYKAEYQRYFWFLSLFVQFINSNKIYKKLLPLKFTKVYEKIYTCKKKEKTMGNKKNRRIICIRCNVYKTKLSQVKNM